MPSDQEMSEATIREYNDVREFFLANPDKESIPLFIFSFGEGSGYGVYQLVDDVLAKHDGNDVVPVLCLALQTGTRSVRYWAAQIAWRFPDLRLLKPLSVTLGDADADVRCASAAGIAFIGGTDARALLQDRLDVEQDSHVRQTIVEVLAYLTEDS